MVAHDPRRPSPPARGFTPETARELREVIAARWRALEESEAHLRDVVNSATREARESGMRPEEVIVALKALEREVFGNPAALRSSDVEARDRFRAWLVSTCIAAYYAGDAAAADGGPPA